MIHCKYYGDVRGGLKILSDDLSFVPTGVSERNMNVLQKSVLLIFR